MLCYEPRLAEATQAVQSVGLTSYFNTITIQQEVDAYQGRAVGRCLKKLFQGIPTTRMCGAGQVGAPAIAKVTTPDFPMEGKDNRR